MKNIAVFASHNGSGLDAILKAVNQNILPLNIALVLSNNKEAKVLQKHETMDLHVSLSMQKTDADPDTVMYQLLKEHNCEYIFLSGYMKKIPSLLTCNFKIINSHPSLLPKYGGAGMYGRFVHEAVIKSNEKRSGVTIHEVNEQYDEGKIILQKSLEIAAEDTVDSLEEKIKNLEKLQS